MQSLADMRPCAHLISVTCNGNQESNLPKHNSESPDSTGRMVVSDLSFEVVYPLRSAAQEAAAGTADAVSGAAGAGLVYSQTSGTSGDSHRANLILVDREKSRLNRLRSSVLTAARLHLAQRPRWKVAMLTLTYAPAFDWSPGQISDLVRHVRQFLKRKGIPMRFAWVQEFTKKGRPHYHLLLWLPLGITLPKPDKRGWWPYGMTKIEWARNAIGYIAKYASKADSLHPPAKGARMHGNGGVSHEPVMCDKGGQCAGFPISGRLEQMWWKLPGWLREAVEPSERVRRAAPHSGGGHVHPATGEVYKSPWIVVFKGGHVYIKLRGVV